MRALAVRGLLVVALAAAGCGGDEERTPPAGGAPAPGGGLTVQQALDSQLEGPLQVDGFLHEENGVVRLCAAILESFPPQCGQPSLQVRGFELDEAEGVESVQGVRWVEQASLLGTVEDRVLTVSSAVIS